MFIYTSIIFSENGNLNEFSDKVTWMEALSKCAEQNQTLAYYQPSSYKFNIIRRRAYHNWIGIRQFYQTEPVKRKFNFIFKNSFMFYILLKSKKLMHQSWQVLCFCVFISITSMFNVFEES